MTNMFVITINRLSRLAMGMEQTLILGFNLDNKRLYCNQCWPMDCNCRLVA